ncbi:alpha/beta fold hydrolase [Saccharomonospora amisosensis]|uniref:alpha/beta fold hydrolase n=1 Tax=Saccharomonospora amisosensis TaxID=1128677 RepID=UPI0028BDA35A|nr:alpha/beta hydrolase [Saccharomonospora amisosensis]
MVLLHGTFSSFAWRDLLRALSHRYQVYVWDMPGYGRPQQQAAQDVWWRGTRTPLRSCRPTCRPR